MSPLHVELGLFFFLTNAWTVRIYEVYQNKFDIILVYLLTSDSNLRISPMISFHIT